MKEEKHMYGFLELYKKYIAITIHCPQFFFKDLIISQNMFKILIANEKEKKAMVGRWKI